MDLEIRNSYIVGSELFRKITKEKTVKHPTSDGFSEGNILSEFNSISEKTQRDHDLLSASLFINSLYKKIKHIYNQIFDYSYSKEIFIFMLVSRTNAEFLKIINSQLEQSKIESKKGKYTHLEMESRRLLDGVAGQTLTADTMLETMIDVIPYWLFQLENFESTTSQDLSKLRIDIIELILHITSIEQSLKNSWLSILWEGNKFKNTNIEVFDKAYTEKQFAWYSRIELDKLLEPMLDMTYGTKEKGIFSADSSALYKTIYSI